MEPEAVREDEREAPGRLPDRRGPVRAPAGSVARAPRRYAWLDRVRGVASLYVVLHHAMQNVAGWDAASGATIRALRLVFGGGHYAVDVFIVLSGYCLMLPLLGATRFTDVRTFLLRRTVRIVGPYYGAMALSLLLIALWIGAPAETHWGASLPVTTWGVVSHLFLVHQWWHGTAQQINFAFWSIGVEYQIYFLFPLFFWAGTRHGFRATTAVVVAAGYALWWASRRVGWPDPSPWGASIYYVGLFCMGGLAAREAWQRRTTPDVTTAADRLVPWVIAAGIVFAFATEYLDRVQLQKRSLIIGAATAAYLYARGRRDGSRGRIDRAPGRMAVVTGWLGKIGFSLYLVHPPIIELTWRYLVSPLGVASVPAQVVLMIVCGGAVSVAAAAAFYRVVEAPCHAASRRVGRRGQSTG